MSTTASRVNSPQTGENAGAPLVLVARQSIYNAAQEVVSYELLYRRYTSAASADAVDGRQATLQVIANAVLELGLDRLAGQLPVHINYPQELLIEPSALPVPAKSVVIEVLENVRATPEVMEGIAVLRARGHRIALDDFAPKVSDPALLAAADIVKLDVSQHTPEILARLVEQLKKRRFMLVAERVETADEFKRCVSLGFDTFQGYFLQHPQVFSAKPVPSAKLGTLRVVAILQNDDCSIADVERHISQDVSLSYRVLRSINSSYYGFSRKVESIRQAVVMLGFEKLRQLCALIALQALEDRPPSVMLEAMIRARMCELLGSLRKVKDPSPLFITGLFSTLDVLTGIPMGEVLKGLALAAPVVRALTTYEGELGGVLREMLAFERGNWMPQDYPGLAPEAIQRAYLDAVAWGEATQGMVAT